MQDDFAYNLGKISGLKSLTRMKTEGRLSSGNLLFSFDYVDVKFIRWSKA